MSVGLPENMSYAQKTWSSGTQVDIILPLHLLSAMLQYTKHMMFVSSYPKS